MAEEKPTQGTGPAPKNIKQIDPTKLGITWTDGHESIYAVRYLRETCPFIDTMCARTAFTKISNSIN
jgi:hypothetical protein